MRTVLRRAAFLVTAAAGAGVTRTHFLMAGAAAVALAAGTTAPAVAAAAPAGTRHATAMRTAHGGWAASAAANRASRGFAGYGTKVPPGSATVAAATFTVPKLSCTTANRAITETAWVNSSRTFSVAFVFTGCVNGKAVYYPGIVVRGSETDYRTSPFAAGDVINLSTSVTTTRTKVQVTDVTTGVTKQRSGGGAYARGVSIGDSGWVRRAGGPLWGVPNFGSLALTNCTIDGKALGSWHPQGYNRVERNGTLEIRTGGFWPGGAAFTTHYEHS